MTLTIDAVPIPLAVDLHGVVRVAGTRVTLDTVVAAFEEGATAEEIAQQYPALRLADVYAVIGFYLGQRPAVEEYLRQRQAEEQSARRQNKSRYDQSGIRERLLARRGQIGAS